MGALRAGHFGRERYELARTAIHESGHLMALWHMEDAADFCEITVVPDGETLGWVTFEGPETCTRRQLRYSWPALDRAYSVCSTMQNSRRGENSPPPPGVKRPGRPQAPPRRSPPVFIKRQSLRGQKRCWRQKKDQMKAGERSGRDGAV
uniref:Peptidase M10 metallopeptidase domain-containing protein n=1 Tax=Globodera rostochiensis TaxID=31243 RepID=A0A914GP59_GLORO